MSSIYIIQHSRTKMFHGLHDTEPQATLPGAVRVLAAKGIHATRYLTHDNQDLEIPQAVRNAR